MSESNFGQHGNEGPEREKEHHAVPQNAKQADEQAAQQGLTPPYWRRMHRDWRVWVGLVLMLVAITVYILSENLAWLPHPPQ
jgi:hypothetical protein